VSLSIRTDDRRKIMARHFLSLLVAAAAVTSGCNNPGQPTSIVVPDREGEGSGSGDGSGEGQEEEIEPEPIPAAVRIRQRGLRIAEGRTAVVLLGDDEVELYESRLTAVVLDEERNPIDVPVTWHSLDSEKVRVSSSGVVTALSLGPAFVTASAGDVIAEQIPIYVVTPAQMPTFDEEGSGADAESAGEEVAADGSGEATGGGDSSPSPENP
jgi:hypothetical protein